MTTFRPACALVLILALLCAVSYAQQQPPKPPISADKAKMMGYVEDFFMNNARDITMRKSMEWGNPTTDDKGNVSITYKFLALIWDKDRIVLESKFTFDKEGKFVNFEKLSAEPVAKEPEFDPKNVTLPVMQGLVEKFFSENFMDITARKTLKWGDVKTNDNGTFSIDYQCEVTIWDKDKMLTEYRFTFDQTGKYVGHEKLSSEPVKTEKIEVTPETKAADQFLAEIAAGNYEKAIALCDETMKKAMTTDMLKKLWTDLTAQFGKSTGIQAIKTEKFLEYVRVHEECRFEKGQAVLMVVVDKDLKISGLFVLSLDQAGNVGEKSAFVKLDPVASRKKAQEGWQCFMQGNSVEGEPLFLAATELNPQNANAWQGLGWSQWSQGKKEEAKKSFEICLTLDKRNTAALNGLGQIAQLAGETEKAIEYWTEGAKLDLRATGPMASLAAVYDGKDDYENAVQYYEMWLRAEPNNDLAKTALAKVKEKIAKQ